MFPSRLVIGLMLLSHSAFAADAPAETSPVKEVRFITYGNSVEYSAVRNQLVFQRFDRSVIGAPELDGGNDNTGTFQLWLSDPDGSNARCVSCQQAPGGPRPNQHVGAPYWHPSGEWLIVAVEMPRHSAPHAKTHAGTGAYVDLWAFAPDRNKWHQLTQYASYSLTTRFADRPVGALIPRLSRRGDQLVWAEMIGYDSRHPFGIWQLAIADFKVEDGKPRLRNKHIHRPGTSETTFYEPWSFSRDDEWITIASDSGPAHFGFMDVQLWHPATNTLTNLTHSTRQFEEQAVFSPDGDRMIYMSTQGQNPPYVPSKFWDTFRTDLWVMGANGDRPRRLTWFSEPGTPEYLPGTVNRAIPGSWSADGKSLYFQVNRNMGSQEMHEQARIYQLFLTD